MAEAWTGKVVLGAGLFLYLGPGGVAEVHAHHAFQIVWALGGDIEVTIAGQRRAAQAAFIPAGESHALASRGAIALLLVEAHGARGRALKARGDIDERRLVGALQQVPLPHGRAPADQWVAWCDAVLDSLCGPTGVGGLSLLARKAILFVQSHLEGTPRLTDAAAFAGCSPGRLTHVFAADVGIPFKRFVLWARIKRAVDAVQSGSDLTHAAHEAGFSDAAHLSRTFRDMFGLSPSLLLTQVELVGTIRGPDERR